MSNDIEDFTVEDARGVVLVRVGHTLPRLRYLVTPNGENNVKIGSAIASNAPIGKLMPGRVIINSTRMSSPVTLIGTEALRTFALDIEDVNEAFDKAMKKHVRTA